MEDILSSDVRIGEFCSSDIQVAINEGNRHRHAFFVVKMRKTACAMPYQQLIPADFSRYHQKLHLVDITLETSCGLLWGVNVIRSLNNVCKFSKGWREFSVENHLQVGHQLLFHLVEKSRFLVRFFDHLGKSHESFSPLMPETLVAAPKTPRPRTSNDAKVILRHFLEMAEAIEGGKEQATEEGKAYVLVNSDDDDKSLRRVSVQESDSVFHPPEKTRTPRLAVEYAEQDGSDNHSKSDDLEMERSPVRTRSSTERASWESEAGHDHREKSSSRNGDLKELVREHGPTAKVLLTQQGCPKRRRGHVTDGARQRSLTLATRHAAGLKTHNFLVVMEAHHVSHGFQLSIPREFLEATGTLRADEVPVYLRDDEGNNQETKWKWHASCQTPFLDCDGWWSFALDHMLEEGDVCVFELVGPGPAFIISVHIFKISAAEINLGRDGGQCASRNQKFERQADADQGRPIVDLGRPSLQKTIQKPYNLRAWTKLFKPRVKAQVQRQSS